MKALTYRGKRSVSVETVPDPIIREPTDAIVRITSTAICGSDLHLYELLGPFLDAGDILGHEPMGIVEEVGSGVRNLAVGDRVVVTVNVACGCCPMCRRGLQSQCETTKVREHGTGGSIFGYTKLYGQVPGGQAEFLRVPFADYNAIVVSPDGPDERYLFVGDILPTAWQGVEYANVPDGGTLAVLGLGPTGQFVARVGVHRGYRVVAVDPVPERRALAERHGVETYDLTESTFDEIRDATEGRGPHSVVDAVGMEASHGGIASVVQAAAVALPKPVARAAMQKAGVDRLTALVAALDLVRRGGTVSVTGIYGGAADPLPMKSMFDRQVTVRMGVCNARRWVGDLLPLVEDASDPLGVLDLVTHREPLERGPELYGVFQKKEDGCIKVVLQP